MKKPREQLPDELYLEGFTPDRPPEVREANLLLFLMATHSVEEVVLDDNGVGIVAERDDHDGWVRIENWASRVTPEIRYGVIRRLRSMCGLDAEAIAQEATGAFQFLIQGVRFSVTCRATASGTTIHLVMRRLQSRPDEARHDDPSRAEGQ